MMGNLKITKKIKGFRREEKLKIEAEDYFDAFYELGKATKESIQEHFHKATDKMDVVLLAQEMNKGQERLEFMQMVSEKGWLKVDGVNYLQRYLNAFYGTAQGAGLGYTESMMMQSENVGCQTIMVQEKRTGEIRMIHAEEDSGFDKKKDKYRYRWVDITIGNNEVEFFYYPELYGFGPAVGVNKTTGMVVAIDDLIAKNEFASGNFTVMSVAFMALDCGDIKVAEQIIERLRKIDKLSFEGGYAIHMAQGGDEPSMKSYECIHKTIIEEMGIETADRKIVAQSNFAVNGEIEYMVRASIPTDGEWHEWESRLYEEMKERKARLGRQAKEVGWLGKSPEDSVKAGLELLADPEGDTNEYTDDDGTLVKCYTGLPSPWVVTHFTAYIGVDHLIYEAGKFLPQPVEGKEYSVRYREDYKFGGKNLTELAAIDRERYKEKII